MVLSQLAGAALALTFAATAYADCESYGIDFQNNGSYFQNNLVSDPFTALQQFSGCENDISHNILVDPDGDQWECSESYLQPDNTPQVVNCTDWPKSSMYSGDWSILIISNNGDSPDPLANERDFYLSVGPQQTTTFTPTVTMSSISTPIVNLTLTQTTTQTLTQVNQVTLRPLTTTVTTTKALVTWTQYAYTKSVKTATNTVPAKCVRQTAQPMVDPVAVIKPTILPGDLNAVAASVIEGAASNIICGLLGCKRAALPAPTAAPALSGSAKFRREIIAGRTPSDEIKRQYVAERHARLHANGLERRFPDAPIVTSTASIQLTITTTSVAPTATATLTSQLTTSTTAIINVTTRPLPVTLIKTRWVGIQATTKTLTLTTTYMTTTTTTSAGAVASCAKKGGHLV
ncbi:hypothetical protein K431DRAFT_271721 [Polychaeton citri CBS 116435]|uniref:Uncharacterized protein n=1 Tax=Polychaeton citri CBS 116435 TaxID=1314669 RepID=A0A9P4Q3J6_9PEZI|nr:hypothetical protein K431DRAFT_271721 [Polychaeton citri CBS 116435]